MDKKNILVFPCGSEIGLEIYRSLNTSRFITLFGASSVDDHGRFVYENYIPDVPFYDDANFIPCLAEIVKEYNIEGIFPAMDSIMFELKKNEDALCCRVISSPVETVEICVSKKKTYNKLQNIILTPTVYVSIDSIKEYPVFLKPEVGYGSRGVLVAKNREEVVSAIEKNSTLMILEYLPGKEFTIDCFTDLNGVLQFVGPRYRDRMLNGISVSTRIAYEIYDEVLEIAHKINRAIKFRGAWFFQLKLNKNGALTLLEIASRLAGSSALYRNLGVNFAQLSFFDSFEVATSIIKNQYDIVLDRALDNKYKLELDYDTVYCDYDDCLILDCQVNIRLVSFLYQALNYRKKIILITKHKGDLNESLKMYKLERIFSEIYHIFEDEEKYDYITHGKSIFIDDSFSERMKVQKRLGIPVFSPDMIECLLNS